MRSIKHPIIGIAAIIAILALFASCYGGGDPYDPAEREKRVRAIGAYLDRSLKLSEAQKTALDLSLTAATARLDASVSGIDRSRREGLKAAFTAGGPEFDAALDSFLEERAGAPSRRETLTRGLLRDLSPFLDSLSPDQRADLFDLLAKRRR